MGAPAMVAAASFEAAISFSRPTTSLSLTLSPATGRSGNPASRSCPRRICRRSSISCFRGRKELPPLIHNLRVFSSKEEVPGEVLEDSKFVKVSDDDPRFGPPALLLLGFDNTEAVKVQSFLQELEGDFLDVLLCTEEMAQGTLGKALSVVQQNLSEVRVAKGLPRITFISGLTGEELLMLIQTFPQAGLQATVFAAHVPKNTDKPLKELMGEIMDDHKRLSR